MTFGEPEPNPPSDDVLEWLGESMSYFPMFFDDDTYSTGDFSGDSWWVPGDGIDQELINSASHSVTTNHVETTSTSPAPADSIVSDPFPPADLAKKRKLPDDPSPRTARKNTNRRSNELDVANRRSGLSKRGNGNKNGGNNGNNKEGRWAEQLLNPCAVAITAKNLSRVQHFLFVLHDLASLSGDSNHRLAYYGLQAIKHHLSGGNSPYGNNTFASSNPKFFRNSLIKFNDINPWFRIPNNVANTSILQILSEQDHQTPTNLHILDIGVSHGVQWPTLLEELTRRAGGPPPLVRLTVVPPPTHSTAPFAHGPPDYDFSSKLLSFATEMSINLEINQLQNFELQNLGSQAINSSPDETLIVCAQFRIHNLNHSNPDERTEFLKILKNLQPKGVILSENNNDCSCTNCGDFTTGFSRRVDCLWRFLDSTSAAYKGRESDERRMLEGEAANVLVNVGEMSERREKWCERMRGVGFRGKVLWDETIDGAKALLRKYDNNWEIRVEENDGGCVGLWWKGQPVSFCSLWQVAECFTPV